MTSVVIDASVALAWCFPDESSDYADAVLVELEGKTILVPAVWSLEVGNAMVIGERRKRISTEDIERFVQLVRSLPIQQDVTPTTELFDGVLSVAREHNLTAYDAAYLELAIRRKVPLATLDKKLREASKLRELEIFAS